MPDGALDLRGSRILIIDDTPANLGVLRRALEAVGYDILVAPDGALGLDIAARAVPDLILLDVVMPGLDGFEACRRLKAEPSTAAIPVLFLSARGETEDIVEGFASGGVDYVVKPFQQDEVLARVQTHLEKARLTRDLIESHRALEAEVAHRQAVAGERNHLAERLSMISQREAERWGIEGFVGRSPIVQRIFEEVNLLQQASATSVLVTGESGTGKELIARALHFGGPHAVGPFVPVNCSAVPAELAESLLFGHARGAFTGADAPRIGYFELADGGTLFLDEIGDMSPDLQPKLLRVLEDGRVLPVGGQEERKVEVRVVASTNADLPTKITAGGFRQDLYFRLAGFTVQVPPLRAHMEDLSLLAQHFLALFAREMSLDPPSLSDAALQALTAHDYPGNVRELKNIIERALIQSRGGDILPEHVQLSPSPAPAPAPARSPAAGDTGDLPPIDLDGSARWVVRRALEQTGGNVAAAARLLHTSRTRIYRLMARDRPDHLSEA